ncbi:L-rhamnonate dehydratase [Streptomyces sp. enrichment culture]
MRGATAGAPRGGACRGAPCRAARAAVGPDVRLAVDANQRWDVDEAIRWTRALAEFDPYWIEEPTSPDDILGHAAIRRAVAPVKVATGEHAQNRIVVRQLLQAGAIDVLQLDAARVGGVNDNPAILLPTASLRCVARGLAAVADAGLVHDLVVRPHQLPACARAAAGHPGLTFVLDHLGKPPVASGALEPWAGAVRTLAALPNTVCKLSGLVTEADPASWTADDLRPYADVVLDAFGPSR